MRQLRYVCNHDACRYLQCERHQKKAEKHIPRIDLCGASQCLIWRVEDDGEMTIHPKVTR